MAEAGGMYVKMFLIYILFYDFRFHFFKMNNRKTITRRYYATNKIYIFGHILYKNYSIQIRLASSMIRRQTPSKKIQKFTKYFFKKTIPSAVCSD